MRNIHEIIKDPQTQLVDVRTPAELYEIAIDGAVNIPMDQVPQRLNEFKDMKGDIVVFCRSGARSESVKHYLMQNGISNVVNGGGVADIKIQLM